MQLNSNQASNREVYTKVKKRILDLELELSDLKHELERVRIEAKREGDRMESDLVSRFSDRLERQLETIEGLVRDKGQL
jgi:hypothetical protein